MMVSEALEGVGAVTDSGCFPDRRDLVLVDIERVAVISGVLVESVGAAVDWVIAGVGVKDGRM